MDILADIGTFRAEIERRRYHGEDVTVQLRPRETRARMIARLLAAERVGAPVQLDGTVFNPQEDLARGTFEDTLQSLRRRAYRAARVHLADAGRYTSDKELEQRIALWRLLADVSQAVSYADPNEKLRADALDAIRELFPKLDLLSSSELDHYRNEVERLRSLHSHATKTPQQALVWSLSRASLAAYTDEPDAALLWCLRASNELEAMSEDSQAPEYLRSLVESAHARVRLMTESIPQEEVADQRKAARKANAYEFLDALLDRFEDVLGDDPRPKLSEYAPTPYVEVER